MYQYSHPPFDSTLQPQERHLWWEEKKVQWAVACWDRLVVQGVQQVEDWEVQPFLESESEVRLDSRDRKTTNKIEPMKIHRKI